MRFTIVLFISLLMIPTLSVANEKNASKKIIVTLPPLSGLVVMLLPEIQSQCLLSAGADPHHFQPSPRQVDILNQGHLLIRSSYDDQGWPIRAKQSQTIDLWDKQAHGWLQFKLVKQALPQLAQALSDKFPQQQKQIAKNLSSALNTITNIEKQWQLTLSKIKKQGVFMQHPAWLGLLEDEHVPVWEVLESHQHGHEHGPRHLEEALNTFKDHPSALLLGSKRHSNRSLEWLNNHQQKPQKIIKLDALGSCNQPWDKLMTSNLAQLRSQL